MQNGQIVRTAKFFSHFQKKQHFGIRIQRKFNFQYTIGKSSLYATKIIIQHDFPILFRYKKNQ